MDKSKKKGQTFFIILLSLIFAIAVLCVVFSSIDKEEKNIAPQLSILSCAEKVFYGGDFSVKIAYIYPDGTVKNVKAEDIVFSSSDDSLIKVENGSLKVVESDIETRPEYIVHKDDNNLQYAKVQLTIKSKKSTNKIIHTIKIFKQADFTVYVESNDSLYFDDNIKIESKYGVMAEDRINALCNLDNNGEIVEKTPLLDGWNFEGWFLVDEYNQLTNERFYPEDLFMFKKSVTIRARFKTDVKLDGDDIGDNAILKDVYYNEPLPSLTPSESTYDRWEFKGWYSTKGGDLNGGVEFKAGDNFSLKTACLYAKWEGTAYLRLSEKLDYVLNNEDWDGMIQTSPTSEKVGKLHASNNAKVVYHAPAPKLAEPEYVNHGKFIGWRTEKYGQGIEISEGKIYDLISLDLYDCFAYEIKFINADGKEVFVDADGREVESQDGQSASFNAIYGQSIRASNSNKSIYEPIKKGNWKSELNTNIKGDIVNIKNYYEFPFIETESKTVCEKLSGTINFKSDIDHNWADSIEVVYNEELNLPNNLYILDKTSWTLAGWYTEKAGDGDEVTNVEHYKGDVDITLHAKLTIDVVRLEYGNDANKEVHFDEQIVYGKTLKSRGLALPTADKVGNKTGYTPGDGWYNSNSEKVTDIMTEYPKFMSTLYFKWEPNEYTITFHSNGGTAISQNTVKVKMDETIPSFPAPILTGSNFSGYYTEKTGGEKLFSSGLNGETVMAVADAPWKIPSDTTLYARWDEVEYTVTLDMDGGSGGTITVFPIYGQTMPAAIAPSRTGFNFKGYIDKSTSKTYYNEKMVASKWDKAQDATLTAVWEAKPLSITVKNGNNVINSGKTYDIGGNYIGYTIDVAGGTGDYTYSTTQSNNHLDIKNKNTRQPQIMKIVDSQYGRVTITVTDNISHATKSFEFEYRTTDSCVATGTLITLADGSQVPVESLKGDEQLLVWNFVTGGFDSAPILFIDSHNKTEYEIIHLYFSDGTEVKVISEHGFWDFDLNEYVLLRSDAAKYIGHWFNKQIVDNAGNMAWTKVQLVNVVLEKENTVAWSPITFSHLCYYVNGMLSMPGGTKGFINIFDVNPETMKVDETKMAADIEKYGLFTYEEFAEYIPREVFHAFNGQYLKVAMGKGLINWDDLYALIDRYQHFWTGLSNNQEVNNEQIHTRIENFIAT